MTQDDETGYSDWVRDEVTQHVLRQCQVRLTSLTKGLVVAAAGSTARETLATEAGKITELQMLIKTLSGGKQ